MKTCKTCKYWAQKFIGYYVSEPNLAYCIKSYNNDVDMIIVPKGDRVMITKNTFGCNKHEEINKQINIKIT